jgi:hypothetical protein
MNLLKCLDHELRLNKQQLQIVKQETSNITATRDLEQLKVNLGADLSRVEPSHKSDFVRLTSCTKSTSSDSSRLESGKNMENFCTYPRIITALI